MALLTSSEDKPLSVQSKWSQAFQAFVQDQISNPQLSVQLIADHFNISTRQLQRRVQEQLSCSPLQYLREARLQTARTYLQEGRFATVRSTAAAVGFQDQRYFAQLFQRRFGHLPSKLKC